MANMNKKMIVELCNQINKKEGSGSIYTIGSKHSNLKIKRWSTGIEDLDDILGGGMPEGRIIEIFGPESAGKTTLAYHLCGLHEMCLDIPIEGTYDEERAKVFGNRARQMLVGRSKFGENAFNKLIKFAKTGIPLEVVDSVPSMISKEDYEKILKCVDKDTIEELRLGGVARLMTKYLPVLVETCECSGTTVVFINQIRDKIGALMFGEKTDTPGGRALKHYCSVRIQVARRSWIDIPNKNPRNSAEKEKIGLILKCKVVKSKICNPLGECEIPLIFERGFISFDDLDEVRKEIMHERSEKYGKRKSKRIEEDEYDTGYQE